VPGDDPPLCRNSINNLRKEIPLGFEIDEIEPVGGRQNPPLAFVRIIRAVAPLAPASQGEQELPIESTSYLVRVDVTDAIGSDLQNIDQT
jgi:hypothetical protein